MKRTDWLIALSLVAIGLFCLTMSATSLLNLRSIWSYLVTLLQICLWIGVPLVLSTIVYSIFMKGRD